MIIKVIREGDFPRQLSQMSDSHLTEISEPSKWDFLRTNVFYFYCSAMNKHLGTVWRLNWDIIIK